MRKSLLATVALVAMAGMIVMAGGAARAAGMLIPDNGTKAVARGGAFYVLADDPTAIALNPGALTRLHGTHIYINNNFYHDPVTFTRGPSAYPQGDIPDYPGVKSPASARNLAQRPAHNQQPWFLLGPSLLATSDFGLQDWTFGFGFYAPSAIGQASYPVTSGANRMLTKLKVELAFVNLAAAWGKRNHYGIGITLQYIIAPFVNMDMVIDGATAGTPLQAYDNGNDIIAHIRLHDYASFSAIVGGWWRIIPQLEVGVSGRIIPVYLNTTGTWSLSSVPGGIKSGVTNPSASLETVLPPTVNVGFRYRYVKGLHEVFDIETDLVYEAWSMMKEFRVHLNGIPDLTPGTPVPATILPRRWRDTFSVRLGGTYHVIRDVLDVSLGGYYETGAVPPGYEDLDFLSFSRYGIGTGIQGTIGPVKLGAAYSHVFQMPRHNSERYAKVFEVRPFSPCPGKCNGYSGVPANNGTFKSSYDILSVSAEVAF